MSLISNKLFNKIKHLFYNLTIIQSAKGSSSFILTPNSPALDPLALLNYEVFFMLYIADLLAELVAF